MRDVDLIFRLLDSMLDVDTIFRSLNSKRGVDSTLRNRFKIYVRVIEVTDNLFDAPIEIGTVRYGTDSADTV